MLLNVRLDRVPKSLLAGSKNGCNYQKAMGLPRSDRYRIVLRKDQCVTASFYLGFFKRERLTILNFDTSELTYQQQLEFKRAVNRSYIY